MSRYFSKLAQRTAGRRLQGGELTKPVRVPTTHVVEPAKVSPGVHERLREVHQEKVIVQQAGQSAVDTHEAVFSVHSGSEPIASEQHESGLEPSLKPAASALETSSGDAAAGSIPRHAADNDFAPTHVDRQTEATGEKEKREAEQVAQSRPGLQNSLKQEKVSANRDESGHDYEVLTLKRAMVVRGSHQGADMPLPDSPAPGSPTKQKEQAPQEVTVSQTVKDSARKKPADSNIRVDKQTSVVAVETQLDRQMSQPHEFSSDKDAPLQRETRENKPVSVRIGSIHFEVHQADKQPQPVIPPASQRRSMNKQRPTDTRLNRYYLRGW